MVPTIRFKKPVDGAATACIPLRGLVVTDDQERRPIADYVGVVCERLGCHAEALKSAEHLLGARSEKESRLLITFNVALLKNGIRRVVNRRR